MDGGHRNKRTKHMETTTTVPTLLTAVEEEEEKDQSMEELAVLPLEENQQYIHIQANSDIGFLEDFEARMNGAQHDEVMTPSYASTIRSNTSPAGITRGKKRKFTHETQEFKEWYQKLKAGFVQFLVNS